jgi:hypothetical protein
MLHIIKEKKKVINTVCEICQAPKYETINLYSIKEKKSIDLCRIHGIEIFQRGEKHLISEYMNWCTIKQPKYS